MPTRNVVEKNKKDFPPGSEIAIKNGCTCNPEENHHGLGYTCLNYRWLVNSDCHLHWCSDNAHLIKKKNKKLIDEEPEEESIKDDSSLPEDNKNIKKSSAKKRKRRTKKEMEEFRKAARKELSQQTHKKEKINFLLKKRGRPRVK